MSKTGESDFWNSLIKYTEELHPKTTMDTKLRFIIPVLGLAFGFLGGWKNQTWTAVNWVMLALIYNQSFDPCIAQVNRSVHEFRSWLKEKRGRATWESPYWGGMNPIYTVLSVLESYFSHHTVFLCKWGISFYQPTSLGPLRKQGAPKCMFVLINCFHLNCIPLGEPRKVLEDHFREVNCHVLWSEIHNWWLSKQLGGLSIQKS